MGPIEGAAFVVFLIAILFASVYFVTRARWTMRNATRSFTKDDTERIRRNPYFAGIFFILALALLSYGWYLGNQNSAFAALAHKATGQVIELRIDLTPSSLDDYGNHISSISYPVVLFTTDKGQQFTFQSDIGDTSSQYKKGDAVEVLYDPSDPKNARIASQDSLSSLLFFLGLIFLIAPIVFVWKKFFAKP